MLWLQGPRFLHSRYLSTQPVSLGLLLPCLQQGQESWGQAGGLNPARATLGKADAPQFLSFQMQNDEIRIGSRRCFED